MARIRTIKPSFFKSEDVAALTMRARLTWVGLWTYVDDEGRGKFNPRLIKSELWPLDDDVTVAEVERDLAELAKHGRIVLYTVDGREYLYIANMRAHQSIAKPTPSRLPEPPDTATEPLPDDSSKATVWKGREGKGKEGGGTETPPTPNPSGSPPARRCDDHRGVKHPPKCGACADARLSFEEWSRGSLRRERERLEQLAKCPRHVGMFAINCSLCASEAKGAK